ncbi:MAG: sodium:solute symporter, partial [Planctomycetaceae bacterium]
MANLAAVDTVVLVAYTVLVVFLGVRLGRGQQDAKSYLLGGKDLPWWAILGSIVATETSTATFLSVPGLAFKDGGDFRFLQLAIGYIVGRSLIVFWLLPLYFRGELFTAYELLNQRFGRATQLIASAIFIVTRNLGDGLRLFLTALVLQVTLGWSLPACVVVIGVATILFTFVGGMKSVVWNDCIQLVVYMAGGLIAIALIVNRLPGGFAGMLEFGEQTERLRMFDFSLRLDDVNTFWAGLIGGAFLTLGTHGTDQMLVQRALAARSQSDAGKAMILSGVVVFLQFALFLLIGLALSHFYTANPPATPFEKTDKVFAYYIVNDLPAGIGLIGILLAAIFSAAMSTLSSSLNSSATAVVRDWCKPFRPGFTDKQTVSWSKAFTVVFGVIQMGIAILAAGFDETVVTNALTIAGFSAGLLLGLFGVGSLLPRVSQRAAMVGLVAGVLLLSYIKFAPTLQPGLYPFETELAWPWLPVVGSVT